MTPTYRADPDALDLQVCPRGHVTDRNTSPGADPVCDVDRCHEFTDPLTLDGAAAPACPTCGGDTSPASHFKRYCADCRGTARQPHGGDA